MSLCFLFFPFFPPGTLLLSAQNIIVEREEREGTEYGIDKRTGVQLITNIINYISKGEEEKEVLNNAYKYRCTIINRT